MSNSNNNDAKREIKIYKKTYRLPMLSGGKLDQLQKQIRQHNEHLTKGRLVVKEENKSGFFRKKIVKKQILEPLSFEESYTELDRMIRNYDLMVNFLKYSENDYQRFFRDLAEEVCEVITEKSNEILEDELEIKEFKRKIGNSLTPKRIAELQSTEQDIFETARNYGYGAVLILKKLDLMSETLKIITSEQDKDKDKLAKILEEMRIDRDIYAFKLKAKKRLAESEKFANVALNFEESLRPVMGDIQGLLSQIAQADQKLVQSVSEIQNIANLIENKQFVDLEKDRESDSLINFLMTSEMKKGRIQEALDQMQGVNSGAAFDAKLFGTGQGITVSDCLGNIREFLDLRLDKFKTIAVPAIEVNEPDLSFYAPEPSEDVIKLDLGNGVTLELVKVAAGKFMMGSPDGKGDNDERPQHQVTLQEFLIGKYAVTNAQWRSVMKTQGSANYDKKFQGDLQPVVGVSWHEARAFCAKVQQQTGREVRLPTEAEWEYAARGANQSKGYEYAGSNNLDEVGWYGDNSGSVTHPVGQKKANELGICDMSGNVWEWCLDEWHDSYADKPENLKKQGNLAWGDLNIDNNDNRSRLLRGGSWSNYARYCRAALRFRNLASSQVSPFGFRVIFASSS
jgi:formylglycine-generating enzyme required for sulfatase activity